MRKNNERWRDWVARLCQEQNLSARELARRASVSNTLINKVLKTGYVPETAYVEAIARGLRQDVEYAKEVAGIVRPPDIPVDAPDEIKGLLRRVYRLPQDAQQRVWSATLAVLEVEERHAVLRPQ